MSYLYTRVVSGHRNKIVLNMVTIVIILELLDENGEVVELPREAQTLLTFLSELIEAATLA